MAADVSVFGVCVFVCVTQQMALPTDGYAPSDPLSCLDQDAAAMAALREAVSRRADR